MTDSCECIRETWDSWDRKYISFQVWNQWFSGLSQQKRSEHINRYAAEAARREREGDKP